MIGRIAVAVLLLASGCALPPDGRGSFCAESQWVLPDRVRRVDPVVSAYFNGPGVGAA